MVLLGGVAGVAVGLAGVYGIGRLAGNAAADPACKPAVETARRMAPLVRGEVAAAGGRQRAENACRSWPSRTPAGPQNARRLARPHRAAEPVGDLVRALPQGDAGARRLQAKLGGADFEVVSINIDTRDPDKPKDWLKEVGIDKLAYYADNSAKVFQDLKAVGKAFGMPTTLLVDPQRLRDRDAWRDRRNGRATTRSSSSPRRSGNERHRRITR